MDRRRWNTQQILIWDLDGVIIDSYPTIVENLKKSLLELGVRCNGFEIMNYIQEKSVYSFIERISFIYNIQFETIEGLYSFYTNNNIDGISLNKDAIEIMEHIKLNGYGVYLYTHRGKSTHKILKKLDINKYFDGIVTGEDGFCRKPHPDGMMHMKDKYNLSGVQAIYYVGSKIRDVEFAYYSRVKSILYTTNLIFSQENIGLKPDYIIRNLLDIKTILLGQNKNINNRNHYCY